MTAIHLATLDDAERVAGLIAQCAAESGQPEPHPDALAPLLDGSPHGAIWLIGPTRAPLGYVTVSFGYSLARGGADGWIEDIYIRPSVRRRGIGTEVLHAISVALRKGGLTALHARVPYDDAATLRFFTRVGLTPQDHLAVLSEVF